jgi:hypothetical protein
MKKHKMRRLIWVLLILSNKVLGQQGMDIRLDGRIRMEYAVLYNLRFDRGRLDRPYRGHLTISGQASHFGMVPSKDSAATGSADENELFIGADTVMQVWKDMEHDRLVFMDLTLSGRPMPYGDTLHPMVWRLLPEHRTLGDIECHLAETHFRGRKYVAWYAPSIPLPHGPWKLGGLPGLILEAFDEDRNLTFRLQSIKGEDTTGLPFPPIPSGSIGDYADYRDYWQENFKRLRRSMAAQSEGGCLSCQTKSKVVFHTWERMRE